MSNLQYPQLADESWLRREYKKKGRLIKQIADGLGCSTTTVSRWLNKHSIEKRSAAETNRHRCPEEINNAQWLKKKYQDEQLSCQDIADELGCADDTVLRALNRHGIETRELSEAVKIGQRKRFKKLDEDWLRQEYVEKEKSTKEISEGVDVSAATVRRWLRRYNISVRNHQEALVAKRSPDDLTDEKFLRELYLEEGHSTLEIASQVGAHPTTVSNWLDRYDIEARSLKGEENPHWIEEETDYGVGWNEEKRQQVRKRDSFACQRCGISESEHLEKFDQVLHVHHIIPANQFQEATKRNEINNLLTLCMSCHRKIEKLAPLLPPSTKEAARNDTEEAEAEIS
jgi:transposase